MGIYSIEIWAACGHAQNSQLKVSDPSHTHTHTHKLFLLFNEWATKLKCWMQIACSEGKHHLTHLWIIQMGCIHTHTNTSTETGPTGTVCKIDRSEQLKFYFTFVGKGNDYIKHDELHSFIIRRISVLCAKYQQRIGYTGPAIQGVLCEDPKYREAMKNPSLSVSMLVLGQQAKEAATYYLLLVFCKTLKIISAPSDVRRDFWVEMEISLWCQRRTKI